MDKLEKHFCPLKISRLRMEEEEEEGRGGGEWDVMTVDDNDDDDGDDEGGSEGGGNDEEVVEGDAGGVCREPLQNIAVFVAALCSLSFVEGISVNGLPNINISSLETRSAM